VVAFDAVRLSRLSGPNVTGSDEITGESAVTVPVSDASCLCASYPVFGALLLGASGATSEEMVEANVLSAVSAAVEANLVWATGVSSEGLATPVTAIASSSVLSAGFGVDATRECATRIIGALTDASKS
jgi:hypothetical protein